MPEPDIHEENGKPTYRRGAKYPAWMLIALPFIALTGFLLKRVRGLHWPSLLATVLLFEAALLFVEHNSVMIGHWVYNQNRILGPEVWGIPIEEPLIYYLFPPIMVVVVFHLIVSFVHR